MRRALSTAEWESGIIKGIFFGADQHAELDDFMSFTIDTDRGSEQHAVVCRDTLDGRVSIEHQTLDGSRISDTELVAVVAPAEADSRVQQCERTLGRHDGPDAATGQQSQVVPRGN